MRRKIGYEARVTRIWNRKGCGSSVVKCCLQREDGTVAERVMTGPKREKVES